MHQNGAMDDDSDPTQLVGRLLHGRYRIGEPLGSGGMGTVYRATHELIGKRVAVKVLKAALAKDRNLVARFTREARAAATIEHPNVCAAHDLGTTDEGSPYLVMELLEGETLEERIHRTPRLEPGEVAQLGAQLCDGLGRAHELGIVHRDLKPGNIVLTRSQGSLQPKILDFGIAHLLGEQGDEVEQTDPGAILGTPPYLSPEQVVGDTIDGRSDLYALGVILFEMLTGQRPFLSRRRIDLLRQHQVRPPPSVRQLRPGVPEALDAIVLRLLAKGPERHYPTADAVAEALRALAFDDALPDTVVPPPAPPPPAPPAGPPDSAETRRMMANVPPRIARIIPRDLAERMAVLAMGREGRTLFVGMADPSDTTAIDELSFLTGYDIQAIGVAERVLRELLATAYDDGAPSTPGAP